MSKLFKDVFGENEYYILKISDRRFLSHGFEREEYGWKHYVRFSELSNEDIENAIESYGEGDEDFLAAMDDLQTYGVQYEIVSNYEKKEIILALEHVSN